MVPRGVAIGVRRNAVRERMTDEHGLDAVLREERHLEREQGQDEVGRRPDCREPARAPGPNLRTDVMHCRNARPPRFALDSEIEVRDIDTDHDVRASR